jgi:hypothetical protein
MTGSKCPGEVIIICASLIFVSDKQSNWRSGKFSPRKHHSALQKSPFLSLGNDSALAGPAPVEFVLNKFRVEIQAGRTAISTRSQRQYRETRQKWSV